MTWKFIVWTCLVSAGLVWSGCEPYSTSSKTTYTGPTVTTIPAEATDPAVTTNPAATTNTAVATNALPTNAVSVAEVAQWPSYYAPDYFQHGNPNEGAYRDAANAACVAQGLNCLFIECPVPPNDELAMHLMHFEHPTIPGYFLGEENSYNKAAALGINRYIFDIGDADASTIARWKYLTKAYPANTVQWVLNGQTLAALP